MDVARENGKIDAVVDRDTNITDLIGNRWIESDT